MTNEINPTDYPNDADNHETNPQRENIVDGLKGKTQDNSAKSGKDSADPRPKPSIPVRTWRALWRKRVFWHHKPDRPPVNWAEITTVCLTLGIVIAAFIQAYIYWKQTDLMGKGLSHNIVQLAIANRNANLAQQTLGELKSGGIDTHNLALAAGDQAKAAKGSAIAAQIAAKLAQDTLNISQRSYVTIGTKDGVVAKFIPSQNPTQNAQLVLYFQNSGHLPAKVSWGKMGVPFIAGATSGSSGIDYNAPIFLEMPPRRRNKKTGVVGEVGARGQNTGYVAGSSVLIAPFGEISSSNLAALPTKNISTLVMGRYQYCDELGTDSLHTFAISYQNAPNDDLAFKLVFDSPMETFPYPSTAETEFLSPCETIAEREETKKLEEASKKTKKR